MICWKLNWYSYGLSRMFQLPQFVWALRSSVWDIFNNFLLIDATDRSKISSDQKRFFIALSLYPFHFSRTLPLKHPSKFGICLCSVHCTLNKKDLSLLFSKVLMQGKLIAVAYTLRTYWNQFSLGVICKQE